MLYRDTGAITLPDAATTTAISISKSLHAIMVVQEANGRSNRLPGDRQHLFGGDKEWSFHVSLAGNVGCRDDVTSAEHARGKGVIKAVLFSFRQRSGKRNRRHREMAVLRWDGTGI